MNTQEATAYSKIKLSLRKHPQEILKIWKKAQGIWKNKKLEPVEYSKKIRQEWERKNP